ncbi:conserved hypothetical protein [Leishmania infantum JPCM5]|uniref:C3H1-type domain-containing protein n=2 Tax=Leishmania infantum TaxID=5671 RepID=A4HZV7_LEIIN|nr:conserved hypothetical protein [Leishmania infantum JPCM5]CAC9487952.1 hypothetical_protein_-_conserved [Leishmania infantum]CAM68021.1 conserved hypothetical protein [Leishmania infantum JPCM5]SUZ41774.1 hypothetical_protein_-_conserved [Leishmania infantum]|eukprot:XP_001465598.1 conserved hypothetical protein [Leishmania infantum JPCM5]
MSWWNDFSTHRNGGVVDGLPRPRQHPASDSFSTQETATQGAVDHHEHHTSNANSPNKSTYVSKANLSDTSVGSGFASHEATWGTATECSDVGSLWQTTTSVCGVTESDQLGVSAAVSAYGSPALQQQQEKPPAQQEEPPAQHPLQPLLLFPTARAVEGVQSSSTKKGVRRGSGSNSDSSDAYCSGGPVGVLSFAMDYYGPSFTSGTEGFKTNAATYSRGGHASSSTHTINDDNDSVVSGDIDEAVDKDVRYEEVDVGTISSLIAALQVRDAANLTDSDAPNAEDEEGKKAGCSSCAQDKPSARDSQAQADTGRGVDVTANSAAANKQQHQQHEVGHTTMIANLAPVFHDPNAGASLIASANTTQSISRRHSSNMYNNSTSGSALAHNASSSSGFYEVPLGEAPSGSVVSTSGRAGPGASPRHHINEVVPLQLTSSTLHNVLASFQSALAERSSDVPLPGTIGDLFNATGRGTSSQNGSNSSGAAGGSRLCHYGSTAQEDWGSQTSAAPATAGASVAVTACGSSGDASAVLEAPVTARNGSPVMRGRVNSVVAHKLNLDGAARRSQMQDLRGSGGFPPAAASLDSTCSSDTHTPTLSTHGRLCAQQHVYTQERAASPDSSGDCFLAHTSSSVLGMLHHHQRVTSSVTTEGFVTPHHHMRTASEVSLPAAAATYHGGSALQQRIDDRGCIAVVDPQRRKLHVPLSAIHMTKALNGRLKTPSLCLLYQLGRCRQGENCYQVHVDSAIVERLRADAKNMPCCCFQHGDSNSQVMDRTAYEGRSLGIAGQFSVPLTRVAYTAGLQRVLQDQPACAPVKASVLCRLHGQPGGCRFGADCRFVHVCCQILQNELASIMANAVAAAQQQQQQSRPANGSPLLVDLINNGLIPSSSGTMHGGASTAMMSLNNAASSVVSAADFSLSQFSQSVPASSTAVMNAFASRVPPSSQQQQSSTPPSVTMQPLPCASTLSSPSAGTYYTLTKLQPQVSQVQTPAGRPFPLQASLLGSPPSACHDHVRTLSTHSNGTYQSYASPPLAQTPNHSEVASPINMGLSMARSLNTFPASTATTAGGSGGAFPSLAQHQLSHQTTPLQRHQPSSLAQQQQQPQRLLGLQQHQQSASQQIYVQQMNTDGSVSLVPINVMQDFGGSGV